MTPAAAGLRSHKQEQTGRATHYINRLLPPRAASSVPTLSLPITPSSPRLSHLTLSLAPLPSSPATPAALLQDVSLLQTESSASSPPLHRAECWAEVWPGSRRINAETRRTRGSQTHKSPPAPPPTARLQAAASRVNKRTVCESAQTRTRTYPDAMRILYSFNARMSCARVSNGCPHFSVCLIVCSFVFKALCARVCVCVSACVKRRSLAVPPRAAALTLPSCGCDPHNPINQYDALEAKPASTRHRRTS